MRQNLNFSEIFLVNAEALHNTWPLIREKKNQSTHDLIRG